MEKTKRKQLEKELLSQVEEVFSRHKFKLNGKAGKLLKEQVHMIVKKGAKLLKEPKAATKPAEKKRGRPVEKKKDKAKKKK
jgi:hypothetical protein